MKEKKQKQDTVRFLSEKLVDSDKKNHIPDGYEIIKNYPLHPPFSYVNILYNQEKSSYLYFTDELKLNHEEVAIYENVYRLIEQSLESPDEQSAANSNFDEQLNTIMKENEKIFATYSNTSLEKVKYYLKRDVDGFGLLDPLMHDINIEDISCSGPQIPIYVWHRNYDSIPTNIQFESTEKLNSFISRVVFRAGKHISTAFPISDLSLQGNHRISVL